MPEKDSKYDPFKPQQPAIPGVPSAPADSNHKTHSTHPDVEAPARKYKLPPAWVSMTLAVILFGSAAAAWMKHSPERTAPVAASPKPAAEPDADSGPEVRKLQVGPGEIATKEELAKPWASREFSFRSPLTGDLMPAEVVRLPGGDYWGFLLKEPYGNCQLLYMTDLKTLHEHYNVDTEHPMVVDPCNGSVFDLEKYGSAPSGLVRGDVVAGPAIRPPLAIEIRVEGNKLVAVRSE
jgi:hypothetical protein